MSRQVGYQNASEYFVDSRAEFATFTTITEAITQAVADGASSSDWKVIRIKAGTYVESFTLPDGVKLVGSAEIREEMTKIQGQITISGGEVAMENLYIEKPTSGATITMSDGDLDMYNCFATVYGGSEFIAFTGAAVLVGTAARVYEDSGGAPSFQINVNGNDVRIQVQGVNPETWDWVSTVTYQRNRGSS